MTPAIDAVSIPVLFLLTALLALVAVESGRWLGLRRTRSGAEAEGPVGASVGATLGLLAFVLAFTFGMAAQRADVRRQMVVEDANAIGTTYLRTSLLPEPAASELRGHLREYVDVRLDLAAHPELIARTLERSEQLQNLMWQRAVATATAQPTLTTTPLFVQALNEMIDAHGSRLAAGRSRIPGTIWVFVFITTVISMGAIGYQAGLRDSRRSAATVCLVVAFAGLIMLIADLDTPQEGFLQTNQQAMLDLQRSIRADSSMPSAGDKALNP
jgi:hypothetical protein